MAVPAPLVFEETTAEGALEGQLVAVDLLVALQVAQAAGGGHRATFATRGSASRNGLRQKNSRARFNA